MPRIQRGQTTVTSSTGFEFANLEWPTTHDRWTCATYARRVTAPDAAMLIVGALCLIAATYVWMISRHHHRMERRHHGWNAGVPEVEASSSLESDLTEWIRAEREERLR